MPLAAKNSIDERYFEVSIASFFTTPMAAPDSKYKRKNHRDKKEQLTYNKATRLKKKRKNSKAISVGHHH